MFARRSSTKLIYAAVLLVTVFAIYTTRENWDSSKLGLNASQLTYWPISTALGNETQALLSGQSTPNDFVPVENPGPVQVAATVKTVEPVPVAKHTEVTGPVEEPEFITASEPKKETVSGKLTASLDDLDFVKDVEVIKNLQSLCAQTSWNEGLWIQCHSNARRDSEGKRSVHGGLNNVRNRIQTCLRVSIDSGAGVIMPKVATRNQTQLKDLGGGEPVPASRFWNMEHMVESLSQQCPQLPVRFDWQGVNIKLKAPKRHFREARYEKGTFAEMTAVVLKNASIELSSINSENQVAISFGDTFIAWDYEKSGELSTIRKDLYRTLKYNQTLLDISSGILNAPALQNGFIGIHLRAETDWPSSFGKAKDQMRLYIQEIESIPRNVTSDLKVLYVSCGSQDGIYRFKKRVTPLGYEVHDKWSLLAQNAETLAKVEVLMFDEKAIIEYQMLLNARFFLGPAMSSMSALIAYARGVDSPHDFFPTHIFPGSHRDTGEDGWGLVRNYEEQVPMMKGDERSKLMIVNGEDIMSLFP